MAKIKSGDVVDIISFSKASAPIGEVKQSMLTLQQFEEENLGTWMLCDGSACEGTAYESLTGSGAVPDMRGAVARMKDHGSGKNPSGDLELGTYQADAFQGHWHRMYGRYGGGANGPTVNLRDGAIYTYNTSAVVREAISDGVNGTPRTAPETRMKNVTLNFFIKVDY